jgi:fructose/tagatose bisphosphate aldolase
MNIDDIVEFDNGYIRIKSVEDIRKNIDKIVYKAVFSEGEIKNELLKFIKELAKVLGIIPSSIQGLYEEMARAYPNFTVPAINIRGLTYDVAKVIFRKAIEMDVGAIIFEIARSEIGYTRQRPLEYSAVIMGAAIKEGYTGPVFIQGDHFQVVRKNYLIDKESEVRYLKGLINEAIDAEFYNIDIDTSTLVDIEKDSIMEQQRPNFEMTAEFASYIRSIQPESIDISIGGEIGEIGGRNSTPEEARAYLDGFNETFKKGKGLSKLSIQTGTSHGGVVLPNGKLAQVSIDFEALRVISEIVRREYGLSGCVQHGASTLPEEAFHMFPETGTSEVHLATGFQNIIYDSKYLPEEFRKEVYDYLKHEYRSEWKEGKTEEQFIYSIRKKGFGPLKKRWWDLPDEIKSSIMRELGAKFEILFERLKVVNTRGIISKTIKPIVIRKSLNKEIIRL